MASTERGMGKRELSLMFTEITPPHGWNQDSDFHYLRLTLPGFEANDITIHMDKYGHLVVRGNRQVNQHKYISFEETFEIPNDAKLDDASGMFQDNQIYCVSIPKLKGQQHHADAVTIPKDHNINIPKPRDGGAASIHQYSKPAELAGNTPRKDYLKVIRGGKPIVKMALYIALFIVLIVITVLIILKLRRR